MVKRIIKRKVIRKVIRKVKRKKYVAESTNDDEKAAENDAQDQETSCGVQDDEQSDHQVQQQSSDRYEKNTAEEGSGTEQESSDQVELCDADKIISSTSTKKSPVSRKTTKDDKPKESFHARLNLLGSRVDLMKDVRYFVPKSEWEYLQLICRFLEINSLKQNYRCKSSTDLMERMKNESSSGMLLRGKETVEKIPEELPEESTTTTKPRIRSTLTATTSHTGAGNPIPLRVLSNVIQKPRAFTHASLRDFLKKNGRGKVIIESNGTAGDTVRLNLRKYGLHGQTMRWPCYNRKMMMGTNEKIRSKVQKNTKSTTIIQGKGKSSKGGKGKKGAHHQGVKQKFEITRLIYTT